MLTEIGAVMVTGAIFGIWRKGKDKNVTKLNNLFKACGIQLDEHYPVFKGRNEKTYFFRLPKGIGYDDFMANEQRIKDYFYPRPLVFSFNGLIMITIGDPLPTKKSVPEVSETKHPFTIPLGQGVLGEVSHDFDKIPHITVSGITRYGKTVLLELLTYMLLRQAPEKAKFAFLDLKGGLSFNKFKNMKQTINMASDISTSQNLLAEIEEEVKKRQDLFLSKGFEKIQQAPWLERIFVIVDEAAQLSSDGRKGKEAEPYKDCEKSLEVIAQVGAGLGIHLVYCTQYPTSKTLPSQVKQNCDATLSFRLRNNTADRVVFDDVDKASKLPFLPGRAIYRSDKESELQVYYVSSEKLRKEIAKNERSNTKGNETREDTHEPERLDFFDSETAPTNP